MVFSEVIAINGVNYTILDEGKAAELHLMQNLINKLEQLRQIAIEK